MNLFKHPVILAFPIIPKQTRVTKEPLAKFGLLVKPIAGSLIYLSKGQGVHLFKINFRDPMHEFDFSYLCNLPS